MDGVLVDFYWPEADLVVEIDSYTYHGGKPSFEEDRRRDTISEISRLLSAAGARTGR